jgi:hypothetical protein
VSGLEDSLYHATLPVLGESHIGHLGPIYWDRTRGKGYLVLTTHRVIFVKAPSFGKRIYDPQHVIQLEWIQQLSAHEGKVTTVFSINGETFTVLHLTSAVKSYVVTGFRDLVAKTREHRFATLRKEAADAQLASERVAASTKQVIAPQDPPVRREREIIKEIVKVPCKFCGALIPVTDTKCSSCSAPFAR